MVCGLVLVLVEFVLVQQRVTILSQSVFINTV